jgi:hypothetical protein
MNGRTPGGLAVALAAFMMAACGDIGTRGPAPTNPEWGAGLPPAMGDLPTLGSPGDPPRAPY